MAKWGSIPVINGLTDYAHPCQVLADLQTIREYKGGWEGLKLTFVGDGNNMANSLIVGGIKMGMKVSIACPPGYEPDSGIMKWADKTGRFQCTSDVQEAADQADVLYTDVWASMGEENEALQRNVDFSGYQINKETVEAAASTVMVMHCLPAHRGMEIGADIMEQHSKEIFDQAENRLHAQKAVLVLLLGETCSEA